jgi:hypothetical protein
MSTSWTHGALCSNIPLETLDTTQPSHKQGSGAAYFVDHPVNHSSTPRYRVGQCVTSALCLAGAPQRGNVEDLDAGLQEAPINGIGISAVSEGQDGMASRSAGQKPRERGKGTQ